MLSVDILRNILSEYIEYDQLQELITQIPGLHFNSKRIRTREVLHHDIGYKKKYTYIDKDLRTIEVSNYYYKVSETHYKNREQNGKEYIWWNKETIKSENNYKDNKLDGKQYQWYENGLLCSEKNYCNDVIDGVQYWWNDTGILERKQNYKNGKKDG